MGILRQILLVVVLGEVEGRGVADLGGDVAQPGRFELTLVGLARRLGKGRLLW
jgi:hypothetical protein